MSYDEAWNNTDQTLAWRFKNLWTYRAGGQIRCSRLSDSAFQCNVGWAIGDIEFFGKVTPYFTSEDATTIFWNAKYRITRANDYCIFVKHRPKRKCVRHYAGVY